MSQLTANTIKGRSQTTTFTDGLHVSSGVGTWGPKMRLGTFNEIILFHLSN